jgi:hypothetical protein
MSRGSGSRGSAYVKVYAHAGVFGTSSKPTGSPLATSAIFDMSTLPTTHQLIDFDFTGINRIILGNGTKYVVTFESLVGGDSSSIFYINWFNPGAHGGNPGICDDGINWNVYPNPDMLFYVYTYDVTNPTNAYSSNNTYAEINQAVSGDLGVSISQDAGANYSAVLTKTFTSSEEYLTYGNGSTETWGQTITGGGITDANFRLKISHNGAEQVYKNFGFSITSTYVLTGMEVAVEAKYISGDTTIYIDHVKIKIYYGTSSIPTQAGSMAFASNGRKNGEGAGVGTGVLVFHDGTAWRASDTGATVAA